MMARIAVVEDDEAIRRHIGKRLMQLGYDVSSFETADLAWAEFQQTERDLYIVDRMLPGKIDGSELCRRMREKSDVPILILSALSEASDRIDGLRWGADDYLNKPFEMEELCLRVESLLKRSRLSGSLQPTGRHSSQSFNWDGRAVDFERYEVNVLGQVTALSPKECRLLKLLIEREGRVVTRDEILNELWGMQLFPSSRTVDNLIVKLRKLLEPDPAQPKYIQSVRGMGYKFICQ